MATHGCHAVLSGSCNYFVILITHPRALRKEGLVRDYIVLQGVITAIFPVLPPATAILRKF